jgi:hypothetical protein
LKGVMSWHYSSVYKGSKLSREVSSRDRSAKLA